MPGNNVEQVTLGVGVLQLNSVAVGFLKGDVILSMARESRDFESGVPLQVQKRVCIRERMSLRAGMAQLYTDKWAYALGGGTIDVPTAGQSRMKYGGDSGMDEYTLTFTHSVPNSVATIEVGMYRASPTIPVEIPFREEEFTVYNAEWGALADQTKPVGEQLGYVLFTGFVGS